LPIGLWALLVGTATAAQHAERTDEKKAPEGAFSGLLPTGFGR
jgi:hypothetical protein